MSHACCVLRPYPAGIPPEDQILEFAGSVLEDGRTLVRLQHPEGVHPEPVACVREGRGTVMGVHVPACLRCLRWWARPRGCDRQRRRQECRSLSCLIMMPGRRPPALSQGCLRRSEWAVQHAHGRAAAARGLRGRRPGLEREREELLQRLCVWRMVHVRAGGRLGGAGQHWCRVLLPAGPGWHMRSRRWVTRLQWSQVKSIVGGNASSQHTLCTRFEKFLRD